MVEGCEADGVRIPISPRESLDIIRIAQLGSQDGAVANALSNLSRERVEERRYRRARLGYTERRVTAGKYSAARVEHVVAQRDCLARDISLVRAATVVAAHDTAVRRRSLRPVDPAAFEGQLFGWVVAGRQVGDKRGDGSERLLPLQHPKSWGNHKGGDRLA